MSTPPTPLEKGQVIASQFRVEKKLGQGGMGSVFLAEQMEMGRKVVVKVLNPDLTTGNSTAVERFRREAQAVARLNHPNIVQIFVFGHTDDGQLYIAMEFIDGHDLGDDIKKGGMAQPRALRILDQTCAALIEAHSAGIIHRDLKPENIMITNRHGNPDYVKVLDFGIAKLHDSSDQPSLTQAGTVFGTPRYMAPEQARAGEVDARADIYALGVILHEMLSGQHPFKADSALDYLIKHVNEPLRPLRETHPRLSLTPRVEALVERCLAKDPKDRFQSVAELQREVRLALRDFSEAARGFPSNGPEVAPRPSPAKPAAPSPASPTRPKGGMPLWGWFAIGGGAALAVVVIILATTSGDARDAPEVRLQDGVAAKASGTRDPGPKPPKSDLRLGSAIDGFPIPEGARSTASTPQAEVFETQASAQDLIAFYREHLHGRYSVEAIPNGLSIADPKSPFSYITLSAQGDSFYLTLSRNLLAAESQQAGRLREGETAFGAELPEDASVIVRSETAFVVRSRQQISALCNFFSNKYKDLPGVQIIRDLEADRPVCVLSNSKPPSGGWNGIALVPDPQSPGAVMISISRG